MKRDVSDILSVFEPQVCLLDSVGYASIHGVYVQKDGPVDGWTDVLVVASLLDRLARYYRLYCAKTE
jgi:hypothetical protein